MLTTRFLQLFEICEKKIQKWTNICPKMEKKFSNLN